MPTSNSFVNNFLNSLQAAAGDTKIKKMDAAFKTFLFLEAAKAIVHLCRIFSNL